MVALKLRRTVLAALIACLPIAPCGVQGEAGDQADHQTLEFYRREGHSRRRSPSPAVGDQHDAAAGEGFGPDSKGKARFSGGRGCPDETDETLAIQNGLTQHRMVRPFLDQSGAAITRSQILDMNNEAWDEPTLGAAVGDEFYYVGASQWGRFDEATGRPDAERLHRPIILRTSLASR